MNASTRPHTSLVPFAIAALLLAGLPMALPAQSVTTGLAREFWKGLSTTDNSYPASAAFTNTPASSVSTPADFDLPQNSADGYGERLRAFVLPPVTGLYTFWVASDEWSDLFLSTSEWPEGKVRIANVSGATLYHQWDAEPNQRSAPIPLEAGRRYFIEGVHKEGSGPDNFSVRWQLPDGTIEEPLQGKLGGVPRLIPFKTNSIASPAFASIPTNNVVVPEGRPVSLIGMAGSTGPVRYQWQRNGTDIPDATNSLFLIPAAQITPNNGERYLCRLFGTTTSSNSPEILLTVTQDTTPPSVTRVLYLDATHLQVTFSEPVTAASITAPAAFALDGGVNILSAALTDPQTALLTTSPMIRGTAYQMTLSGIQDGILHPNTVPAGTRVSFTALELIPVDLGNPTVAGKVTSVPGGYDMTSSTKDIAGAGDQFGFNWEVKTGNFDVAVRVSSLEAGDPWAKAGLMARGGLTTASPFAMVVTTPGVEGTYFLARQTPGASTVQSGSLPPNPPETWLRLRREENLFTGFTSRDGENWARLGSTPLAIPSTLYLGLALTSHGTNLTAAAGFRDLGDATGSENSDSFSRVEPPGPSSRKTGVAITEIMYKPAPLAGITNNLEFVELYNSNPYWENIGGYRLAGDIQFTFPEGTLLQGGARIVVALDPEALQQARHITGVSGPYAGSLKSSGLLQLLDKTDAVLLEIPYSNLPPWPVGADGTGHSLVLARPSYGEGYAAAWDVSDVKGGSPGAIDPVGREPLRGVLINEFLASSTPPDVDFIELYNHTRRTVDLSGAWLSDSGSTNKFRIPDGTTLSPGGFIAFTEADLHFSLTAAGETIYLVNPANTRVIDAIRFEAQRAGISTGRFPDGSDQLYPLARTSAGKANGPILMNDIVINELLYKPISGNDADGFVELFNQGSQSVDLGGWKFTSGISYKFPAGTLLAPGGYLVVARDRTNLMARYPGSLTPANTLGNYSGKPTSDGGRVALAMPVPHITQLPTGGLVTNTIYPVVDEVTFGTGGRWGEWANGGGSSLELKDPRANHRLAYNWGDSDDTHKAPWTPIEATGIIDNSAPQGGSPINRLEVTLLGAGEYLLDNVEVLTTPSANVNRVPNPDFESGLGAWTPQGDHIATTLETTEGFQSSQSLHVRASARGDTGANRVRVALTTSLNPGATCTIRAKVRWLRGWPETVLRLKGNGFELAGAMQVPTNLGTPGQPNSQAQRNAAPAISDVHHSPVLPAAGQPVVVTARAQDPDGLQSLTLVYRLDPATGVTTVPMKDDGLGADLVAGDGLYSAYLPGQPAGTLAAFYIEATDKGTPPLTSRLPEDAPVRECLVRFGEPTPASGYATYHFLMTANNVKTWINRPSLSNERVEGTFVYGNFRAIYGISGKYAGSPYHQGFGSPVTDPCHYSLEFPLDDILLGTENFNKIHAPGNGPFDDTSLQREQTSYWMMRQMGLPWNYRRFVAFYFNGNRKQTFMEDSQTPGSDVVSERWPNDSNGNLYKLQPWFEFDDVAVTAGTAAGFDNVAWCSLMNFYTGTRGDVKKLARYRYNFLTRAANGTANDYTNVWDLTDAANTPPGGDYVANMKHFANMEQWMRTFAVQHSVGNWDSFGNRNSQNMYGYKPTNGKWTLMTWDFNIVLGNSGSDGPTGDDLYQYNSSDSAMLRIYQTPEFRRMYIRAFKEIIEGPMAAGSPIFSLMDAKYAEILASGQTAENPSTIKTWLNDRRGYLLAEVKKYATNFAVLGPVSYDTNGAVATLVGTAPVDVERVVVNGVHYPLVWGNPLASPNDPRASTTFRIVVPLAPGDNTLVVEALDRLGNPIAGMSTTNTIHRVGTPVDPRGLVVFSEINYRPSLPNASFIEIQNISPTELFDLSGWRIDGVGYTFPLGSIIANGQALVVAKDRTMLWRAFGTDVPVAGDYPGGLFDGGEVLSLIRPGETPDQDVLVDRIRFESVLPWPQRANGQGASLQVIDPTRDRSRVSNWSDQGGARWTQVTFTATNKQPRFFLNLTSVGDAYIDDISLKGPDGVDLLNNGNFEAPLAGTWGIGTNYTGSTISTEFAHSGHSSLHIVNTYTGAPNPGTNQSIYQDSRSVGTNVLTLSFWYLPGTNALGISFRTPSLNPTYAGSTTIAPQVATPGLPNNVGEPLPEYPPIWLNEVLPYNVTGVADNQADRDPWIELYNAGSVALDVGGLYLSDDYSNLAKWSFPPGSSIAPGGFLMVWADGEPEATTRAFLHTSFRLALTNGAVLLSRVVDGVPKVLDYLNYAHLRPDQSYGSFPDGQPFYRGRFTRPTPGTANDGTPPTVKINEWMASNSTTLIDAADGKHHDWLELYNPSEQPADLGGYYLSTSAANPIQFLIPQGTVLPPLGYLLVWADKLDALNRPADPDLHANFNLSKSGGVLLLTSATGVLLDQIAYGKQVADVSEGRFPDGTANIMAMSKPSPRMANTSDTGINTPPKLAVLPDRVANELTRIQFTVTATDNESPLGLSYSLEPGAPEGALLLPDGRFRWRPTEAQGPGLYSLTVRVTDTGTPSLSDTATFKIQVNEVNLAPVYDPRGHYLKVGEHLQFLAGTDPDLPANQLLFTLPEGAPAGATLDPVSGQFSWTPTAGQAGRHSILIRVTDNGVPPLSTLYASQIEVVDGAATLLVAEISLAGGSVVIHCSGTAGKSYQLEYAADLGTPAWQVLRPAAPFPTASITFNETVAAGSGARYYRVVQTD